MTGLLYVRTETIGAIADMAGDGALDPACGSGAFLADVASRNGGGQVGNGTVDVAETVRAVFAAVWRLVTGS